METPLLHHPLHLGSEEEEDMVGESEALFSPVKEGERETDKKEEEEGGKGERPMEKEGEGSGGDSDDGVCSGYEDLPMTQEIDPRPLAGLFVFVDVRSGTGSTLNRSEAVAKELKTMGATVCQRFIKDVTHVVFKDGRPSTREKAEKKGVYLVSPLWIEACKKVNDRISEAKYPIITREGSDTPVILGRIKRIKSMQPKPLDEEITKSLERSRKRQRPPTDDRTSSVKKRPFQLATEIHVSGAPQDSDNSDMELSLDSSCQDSFELPVITLPGTPSQDGATVTPTVTPESTRCSSSSSRPPTLTDKPSTAVSDGGMGEEGSKAGAIAKQNKPVSIITGGSKKRSMARGMGAAAVSRKPRLYSPLNPMKRSKVPKGAAVAVQDRKTRREGGKSAKDKENDQLSPDRKIEKEGESGSGSARKRKVHFRDSKSRFEREKPTLVLTSVPPKDQEIVLAVIAKLGGFETSNSVSGTTTHVVSGAPRRTINVLAATVKGCWILSTDWVWKSLELGKWVKEEPYEMADHFPSAQFFRLERQQAGLLHRPSIFAKAGSIFISSDSTPPSQQLELLLSLGGAKITASHRKADVCVGCKSWNDEVKSVSEQWVLDSISEHQLLPTEDYLMDNPRSRAASPEL